MGSDTESINQIKMKMCSEFKTKDLGLLKYFLGIEVLRSKHRSIISQRKYVQYFLKHTRTMGCHPVDTPMDTNVKLCASSGEDVDVVSLVSLYMHKPQVPHWQALERILSHLNVESIANVNWAGSPNYKKSTSRYCILVRGNLVTWKSKKENVVARSSAKEEYRAMGHSFMKELTISKLTITFQREAASRNYKCQTCLISNQLGDVHTKSVSLIDLSISRTRNQEGEYLTRSKMLSFVLNLLGNYKSCNFQTIRAYSGNFPNKGSWAVTTNRGISLTTYF
ncbi:uncharacterized mitochondrial protein AtMg00810-like [Aristolochia californica]|uniref:uncharacterized mitochondrial protein AtMg00810-like n=1 Tax=Aristolochia californica TaxID=171875 RepID=UPI0035DF7D17